MNERTNERTNEQTNKLTANRVIIFLWVYNFVEISNGLLVWERKKENIFFEISFCYASESESESYLLTFTKHIVQSISNKELQFLDYKVYRFTYFTGTREVLRVIKHELIKVNTDLRTSCSVAHIICKKIRYPH